MQERFGVRCVVEITTFEPEQKIGDEPGAAGDMLAKLGLFIT